MWRVRCRSVPLFQFDNALSEKLRQPVYIVKFYFVKSFAPRIYIYIKRTKEQRGINSPETACASQKTLFLRRGTKRNKRNKGLLLHHLLLHHLQKELSFKKRVENLGKKITPTFRSGLTDNLLLGDDRKSFA